MTNQRLSQTGDPRVAQNGTDVRVWDAITDYVVQYRTTAGPGAWTTFSDPVTATTGATVTGLTNGISYDFRVASISSMGRGQWSNIFTIVAGAFQPPETVTTTITATTTVVDGLRSTEPPLDVTITATTTATDVARRADVLDTLISGTTDLVHITNFKATVATNWGTWTAAATGSVAVNVSATIATNWGTVTATGTAVVSRAASSTQSWGTWTAAATGVVTPNWFATVTTSWGTWNATGTAIRTISATVATSFGTWVSTATAGVSHIATSAQSWGTWNATATGVRTLGAAISAQWGTWTATATGDVSAGFATINATISTNWSAGPAFSPNDIPGMSLQLEADRIALANGADVYVWPDVSSNDYDMSCREGTDNPPAFVTNVYNGQPTVRFVHANAEFLFRTTSIGPVGEIFVVAKYNSATFADYDGLFGDTTVLLLLGNLGASTFYPSNASGPTYYYDGVDSTATRQAPMGVLAVCGLSLSTPLTVTPTISTDRFNFPRFWDGDIPAIITYDHALTPAERGQVNNYLLFKYKGVGSPPSTDGWTATATGTVTRAATITTNWGTWNATGVIAFIERNATISTNWGTWLATAGGTDEHPSTITSSWGTWNATATAGVSRVATGASTWGTWTATATASAIQHPATIASNWGGWTGAAAAGVSHSATVVTVWGWTATATATVEHPASASGTWGTWNATATALHQVYAGIATTWPWWIATATAAIDAKINTNWGTWTATANATAAGSANITTVWGTWTATATASRETFATSTSVWTSTWSATAVVERSASITTVWGGSAPFSPNDIPGLALWLEADQLPIGDLAVWSNPGSGPDAPILGTPLPVVVNGVTPSGQKVVRFTTGEGRIRLTGFGFAAAAGLNWTVIYVARMRDATLGRVVGAIYSPANLLIGFWNGFENVAYVEGFLTPDARRAQTTNWRLYTGTGEGVPGDARAWLYEDGVYSSGGHPVTGGWQDTFAIGGFDPSGTAETSNCDVAGVLFYDSRLADPVRAQAEDYMRTKYLGAGLPPAGGWSAIATATVDHPATITLPWGAWTATATAEVFHTASIDTNWGTWTATAIGSQLGQAVAFITTVWPAWTATATAQPILHYGTVNTVWSWTATATAGVNHIATGVSTWGTWTGTATAQPIQRNATVASNWGTWTTAANATVSHTASIATNWGTWNANANGGVQAEEIFATISTNWGTWTATGVASVVKNFQAQITSNWGTWTATAAAGVTHPATITTTYTAWTATATAQPILHPASISTTWGPVTVTATATVEHVASITTTWAWTATATAKRETWATITTTWDATFTASAAVNHWATGYSNFGRWEATAFGIAAPRGTTINEADTVYLGDEAVDRIYLDGVIVWELV